MNGFLIRWAMAFVLLAATYNPTDWNYVSWTMVNFNGETAMMVLMGLLLMAGYIIYLRATLRSIGMIGMGLVSAIVAAGVWLLIDQDIIQLGNATVKVWFVLVGLSFVLGIGLSWSFVRRAMSGQYDVDDADD
jgi:hypothetical protein